MVRILDASGRELTQGGSRIMEYGLFRINPPPVQLNISYIQIYNVTDNPNPRTYTGGLLYTGTNDTFHLYPGESYRIEVLVENLAGSSPWEINSTSVAYLNLNGTWNVSQIWYSNLSGDSARIDDSYYGGIFDGNVTWNTSKGGVVYAGGNATFLFIVNISSEGDYGVVFRINSSSLLKEDNSVFSVSAPDTRPPSLFNSVYGITEVNVTRGQSTVIYARWDETIGNATAEYNTTSQSLINFTISLPDPNPENWTNHTISTTSLWGIGRHVAKIYAADIFGNWNGTLQYLDFYVWGIANITSMELSKQTVSLGDFVEIRCEVFDATNSSALPGYPVYFYNSTGLLGTNGTNSTGWATYAYYPSVLGTESVECRVYRNETLYYHAGSSNSSSSQITVIELEPPKYYSQGQSSSIVHKTETVNLSVYWTDNYQLSTTDLWTNETGSFSKNSTLSLSGNESWANFSYTVPSSMTPGYLGWFQNASDSSGNTNATPVMTIEVWGWSMISESSLNPQSIYVNDTTEFSCRVVDANSTDPLQGYLVEFYNSTGLLGTNETNSTGWAKFVYNDTTNGTEDLKCVIYDNTTMKYNATVNESSQQLTTQLPGVDTIPPSMVSYGLNASSIYRGEEILAYAQWNETIGNASIEFNSTSPSLEKMYIDPPYTDNWTNYTISTNTSWYVGIHHVRISAADENSNWNTSAEFLNFSLYGYSAVAWVSPVSELDRGISEIRCNVTAEDTGEGIAGYGVKFYNSSGQIGYNTTDSQGVAVLYWNSSTSSLGPQDFSCTIQSEGYWTVNVSSVTRTLTVYGTLNATIISPHDGIAVHKGDVLQLSASVRDGNGEVQATVEWFNSTSLIAAGNETAWQIPVSHTLGAETITANASGQYYRNGTDNVTVYVWGYSSVNITSPATQSQCSGDIIVTCLVYDSNTSEGIQGYPVEFGFRNDSGEFVMGENVTDSSGYASLQWTPPADGNYTLICRITDNATLYYNASKTIDEFNITVGNVGTVNLTLHEPVDNQLVGQNRTFLVNVTIYCSNNCSGVYAYPRYNASSAQPDTAIPNASSTPFWVVGEREQACPPEAECNLTWDVNTTGQIGEKYTIDVYAYSACAVNQSNSSAVEIGTVYIMSTNFTNVSFPVSAPGDNSSATNNTQGYVISLDPNSNGPVDLWIRADNMTGPGGYVIEPWYIKASTFNDPNGAFQLNYSWQVLYPQMNPGENVTSYYWISTPFGRAAGKYTGTIYYMVG